MRKICFLLAIFLISTVSVAAETVSHVVISEICTDEGGTEGDDEFVELFNPTSSPIDLTGWKLIKIASTCSESNLDFKIEGAIPAFGFYYFAPSASSFFGNANEQYSADSNRITNDNGVKLIDNNGNEVDAVWWGVIINFKCSLLDLALNPPAGQSIERKFVDGVIVDTDNNFDDFGYPGSPTPTNSAGDVPEDPNSPETDSTPPTTTANPAGGIYAAAQTVTLTADEPATIFYSTNSETLKEDFSEYSASLEISENTTLRFFARDEAENEEGIKIENYEFDFEPPDEVIGFSANAGDTTIDLSWTPPDSADLAGFKIYLGDEFPETLESSETSYSIPDLNNWQEYSVKITTVDFVGNESMGATDSATPQDIFTTAKAGEVVINEIAWAGSSVSSSDEWIELKNTTTNKTFELLSWTIVGAATKNVGNPDGNFKIMSIKTLAPDGYFLISNYPVSDKNSILEESDFDSVGISFSNGGEVLILKDSADFEIDQVDGSDKWGGEDAASRKTLARVDSENSRTSFEIDGTPRSANFPDHDLAISEISASPESPLPNEIVIFTVNIENRGLNSETNFKLKWLVGGEVADEVIIESLESFDLLEKTFSRTFDSSAVISAVIDFSDEKPENNSAETEINPQLRVFLAEVQIAGTEADDEFIEIYNPTEDLVNLLGWKLKKRTAGGTTSTLVGDFGDREIPAGEFLVARPSDFATADEIEYSTGARLASGNTILLFDEIDILIDSLEFSADEKHSSIGRLTSEPFDMAEFWHPTRGAANIFPEANEPPVAVITLQSPRKTSGSCNLRVNLTAEDSTDPDGDDLEFEWDFGNGSTSDEENPGEFYFSPGNYTVTLVVTDVLKKTDEATQTFTVSGCSSGGGGGDPTTKSSIEKTDEPVFDSISASRVEMKITEVSFDSSADWIEIQMLDDGNSGNGIDVGGFYFEVDKRIKTIPKNTKMKTGEFLLLEFKSEEKDSTKSEEGVWEIFTDRSGLTKTDEQITLRDSSGMIEDAVVWENRNGAWSRGEDTDIAEIVENGGWVSAEFSDAIDSSAIEREIVIARFPNSADTDSAVDWFATPFATPGKENSAPPTSASEIEFLIAEVASKNPSGDRVRLTCVDCGSEAKSLAGFFLQFGENKIFEFPAEFEISSGAEVEIIFGAAEESFSENIFHSTFHGLAGSDGLLMLADFAGTVEDFVGWSDRSAPPNRESDLAESEMRQLEKQFADRQWHSELPESLIDSRKLPRGGSILRRNSNDTNSAVDFEFRESAASLPEIEKMAGEILISEILPNPRGTDSGAEWFELENIGGISVELFGWQVFAGNGSYEFEESVILAPNEFRAFHGLLPIRNSGDIFTLLDADGETVDSVEYPEIREGVAFAKNSNGEFLKTEIPTPDAANGFYQTLSASEDADADGLSDLAEMEFGTDPEKFDTDGDGFPDYFEIQHGFDPNSPESSPENLRGYRAELAAFASSRLDHSIDGENGVFLAGAGVPGGRMRIYIHSELSIVEIPIAEDGSWSYALDQPLEAGNHNIFTQLIDPMGVEGVAKKVLNFDLVEKFTPPVFTENIRISEILPNPAGLDAEGEFIELENFGSEPADLSNFYLTAGRKKFTFPENSAIPASGFLVLSRAESGLTLPNAGGSISLAWPTGRTVAELSYKKIREGVALAFDGSEFRETATPTPAAANKISAPEIHSSKTKKVQKNRNGDLSDAIQISEILANPVAEDSAAEWIEIWNSGSTAVNLGNWRLDDSAGGSQPFVISDSTILQSGEFKIFSRPLTKIALNNSGREAAQLFDFEGRLISKINFESPPEGSALAFDGSEFRETVILTPNAANEFDSQKIEGTIRFAGEEGFVIENSSGEFFVKFSEGSSVLLARALLREGEKWKIFVENSEGNFTFKNFAAAPKLLRSQLLSSTNSPPLENQNPAWILALLIFAVVFFSLRFAKLGEVWDSQN